MTREVVYGRRPVREALRAGRRQVLELLATERALVAEPWLRDEAGLRVHVRTESALTAEAGTRDHQGVVALCEPYRYVDAYDLADVERPLIACLDQVTDPHNLGAICRSAEGAAATAIVVPEHRAARVTPAVCRASAGAVEHVAVAVVVNLARFVDDVKRGDVWAWAAAGDAQTTVWSADFARGTILVFGSEGKGVRPGVRRACDDAFSIPLAGRVESLNVSVAAGVALFEAARQRTSAGNS